jgi:catalase
LPGGDTEVTKESSGIPRSFYAEIEREPLKAGENKMIRSDCMLRKRPFSYVDTKKTRLGLGGRSHSNLPWWEIGTERIT